MAEGGCLCGAVRFELTGPPEAVGYCHCTRCQRRTGTGSSANARTERGSFRLVQGEDPPGTERLLDTLARNPFQNPPPYEKLRGDLAGAYSRRINIQHRLVYQVHEEARTVKVIRMWTHYE